MKNFFSGGVLFLFIINLSFSAPILLGSFEEIYNNLVSGEIVRVIIDYSKCVIKTDTLVEYGPNCIGGMDIENFEYFAEGTVNNKLDYISCSETVLINHPRYNFVLNYIKLKIYEDNSVSIQARYLDPQTYEVKMVEDFYAEISNNINNLKGISFYKKE